MQLKMDLNGGRWGGLRKGAGRKRIRSRGVSHRRRESVKSKTPLHINVKFRTHLRNKATLRLLKHAIQNARSHGLKVLHYSFQTNHIHLIVEASDTPLLTKGMRSLTITFAKRAKLGRIQLERYHLHVLKTVKEVRHAIHYVLFNEQRHLEKGACTKINGYSSLLSVREAPGLIKEFAKEKKMTIEIEKTERWEPDISKSYLYKKGWSELQP